MPKRYFVRSIFGGIMKNVPQIKSKVLFVFFCLGLLVSNATMGQRPKPQNLSKYDQQRVHFGFLLGLNHADFIVRPNPNIKTTPSLNSIYVVESEGDLGFTLGIVSNLHMGPYFDLRFIPALAFSQRSIEYTILGQNNIAEKQIKTIESTFLEFPFHLKYKSVRVQNGRAFVLGGARYSIDLASQKDVSKEDEDLLKLKRNDLSYEVGFGIDFYLTYFKFSPVIVLSIGMNDMLFKEEPNVYSNALDKLFSKVFLFAITFE